jgi:S1-C subfamily serine protease/predicted esterase
MLKRYTFALLFAAAAGLLLPLAARAAEDQAELAELQQKAVQAAVKKVAPSVVQIETSGGTDVITSGPTGPGGRTIHKGIGPTSGVVVSADGYVISSAFNFANKPTSIFVSVAGQKERFVAKVVATDQTRMLTLLKLVDGKDLPVPTAAPKKELKIGQTAVAVGRTLSPTVDDPPSVTKGIISAIDRIWGRTVQTDAKISPANYGGPVVDLYGRVVGILVPASPRGEDETAGFEWYDSGIGFAVPLEDINAALPRMKKGTEKVPVVLKRGMLGITMKSQDQFEATPVVGAVNPTSAAERFGIKPNDLILAIDDKPVANLAQMLHALGSKYEGDSVTVKLKRGEEEITLKDVVLSSAVATYGQPFLGIVPMRDDTEAGVEVRYVYPKSPAESAGVKAGDRILKFGIGPPGQPPANLQPVTNRDQLQARLDAAAPGMEVKLEVKRKDGGKTETLSAKLTELPDIVPDKLPEPGTIQDRKKEEKKDDNKGQARTTDGNCQSFVRFDDEKKDDEKKIPTGLLKRTTGSGERTYFLYVPENYNPKVAHALVIWLHPANKGREKDIEAFVDPDTWGDYCDDNHFIVVAPTSENEKGWVPGDAEFIQQAVKDATDHYTIDKRRVVAHGMGVGGQMALYLGFHNRALVRGVATTGAALSGSPKEKVNNQPLAFFLVAGGKDPLKDAIADTKNVLKEHKYPVIHREIAEMGHEYLDRKTLEELIRWIDSLDRM